MRHRIWPVVVVVAISVGTLAASTPAVRPQSTTFEERERQVSKALTRASQFVDVYHISSAPACEDVQPPEALATPDPILTPAASGKRVKVSFIIGTDGRVHSPLILESAGLAGDRHVLQTVRTWRYLFFICNAATTETEGKIEFSSR